MTETRHAPVQISLIGAQGVRKMRIYEGTNQIQRMVIARKTFSGVR